LHYRDSATGQTLSCSDPCPLSTDPSLLYQDFLFGSPLSITGVQIKLSDFTGTPGLHLLQLLSSGAFASAVDSNNDISCFAPTASNTTRIGSWAAKVANTNIPGTVQTVLVADVNVGTSSSSPSLTWFPYVSAAGNYDVNLLIPGCTNLQDCALRTTVKLTVFPGENLQPWESTISQQNTEDATVLVYSGPISFSSSNFTVSITMTISDASSKAGKYEIVADRVQLILRSNPTTFGTEQGSGTSDEQGIKRGFGFWEWPRNGAAIDATNIVPNSSETSLDAIAFTFFEGAGGGSNGVLSATSSAITTVVHHSSGLIILGGNFSLSSGSASGSANIVAYKDGTLRRLTADGLNGPVTSLLLNGDLLFIGGKFTDTPSGSTGGQLRGIAVYDVQQATWSPLGAGLNGEVKSLGLRNAQLQVAGNFTELFEANGAIAYANGFALWDIETSSWVNSGGFLVGAMTLIANESSSTQLLSGHVLAARKYGASGMVFLKNGDASGPTVTPLGAQLVDVEGTVNPTAVTQQRRSLFPKARAWVSNLKRSKIHSRQTTSTQLPPLPPPLPAFAPSVLTGIFWTNSSSSTEVVIFGGNFSFYTSHATLAHEGVALYNPSSGIMQGLQGAQINGTVRALLVDGNQLYIGGEFQIHDTNVNGLAIYDLSQQAWSTKTLQALQAPPGSHVVVRSITKSTSQPSTIVIAGSFSHAGSFPCQAICAYNSITQQWNALGNGIRGEVAAIAYAGVSVQEQGASELY